MSISTVNNLNILLKKITEGKFCTGMVVTLNDPAVSELAGEIGYDFTWIDMEHAPIGLESALNHVMAVRGTEAAPFIRVPGNEYHIIKPILELAPAAVIIPMVNNAEDAANAVASCRYPGKGMRGCGSRRGSRFGNIPTGEYYHESLKNPLVIVQIESIEAVDKLDEILAVPGIDGICVGPCDLSASMDKFCQVDDPEVVAAVDIICAKSKAAGKLLGTATSPDSANLKRWMERGVQWMALSCDWSGILTDGRKIISDVNSLSNPDAIDGKNHKSCKVNCY
jgi:2-dehydro-3-deoxyglucarate aldolase/4-hydroxy-2-oxoheptanedioate aldolase